MLQFVTFEMALALASNVEVAEVSPQVVREHDFGGLAPLVEKLECTFLDRPVSVVDIEEVRANRRCGNRHAVIASYRRCAERARRNRREVRSPRRGDTVGAYLGMRWH